MKVESESEVAQSCPTLRDPIDCNLPGSSAHGIFQARVLQWGATPLAHHTIIIFGVYMIKTRSTVSAALMFVIRSC